MYCPSCGTVDRQANQFCRACGADLRTVMTVMANPDDVTASASAAREQIGQALAGRIKDIRSISDMSVLTEEILPEIEKFLESPEERRLRRMRNGSMVAFIGIGVMIAFALASFFADKDLIVAAAAGLVTFFVGSALFVNGYLLTVPKRELLDNSAEADLQRKLDGVADSDSVLGESAEPHKFTSVTESTTRNLIKKNKTNEL